MNYRTITIGEPLQVGDEFYVDDNTKWSPIPGLSIGSSNYYFRARRPDPIGVGYRAIETGEIYLETDEISYDGKSWESPTGLIGDPRMEPPKCIKYARRKLPAEVKPPLGLKPRSLHDNDRHREVFLAIQRYVDAALPIPPEWWKEYVELWGGRSR